MHHRYLFTIDAMSLFVKNFVLISPRGDVYSYRGVSRGNEQVARNIGNTSLVVVAVVGGDDDDDDSSIKMPALPR